MDLVPGIVSGATARLGAAAQNAFEIARFGGLDTGEEPSPYEVVAERSVYRLRRYFPPRRGARARPPVVLVPPMMLAAEVYDVSPASSAVALLRENGVDPWVIDFGAPEREEGGLERTLSDHVVAIAEAVDVIRDHTGRDVHLSGYSQGGMFCYQTAAFRRSRGIASVITFGAPVDTLGSLPFGLPEELASRGAEVLAELLGRQALPAWASRTGFRLLDPLKSLRERIDFARQLHDRDALLPRERQRRFLQGEGWVAWPGPAIAELMRQFVVHNRMLSGGFVIDDRLVTLADIDCPVLCFVGEVDEIASPRAVRAVKRAAPRADLHEVTLSAGHFGLVVGSRARETTWPTVAQWALAQDGERKTLPDSVHELQEGDGERDGAGLGARAGYGLQLVAGLGVDTLRSIGGAATGSVDAARELVRETPEQLRRLGRLGQVRPGTRVSLGLLLDEQAERAPDEVFVLLEGRAYPRVAVKDRIDAVVRGLVSVGVRQGEHVGVLMNMRPSALTVVAALNRLGAVVVLLRPDGPLEREARLGQVRRIVSDPELAARASEVTPGRVLVLGGGAEPRDLGVADVIDMERIDPGEVELPDWYRPNPGRGRDLAFVLFTGSGEGTRANRVTNRRWALSAFGTASSAALSPADTVYSVTPIHHPSSLLMSTGGAVAGGARFAMATGFDPATFWDEVRRYGATIVSYTWTMLHELTEAPLQPGELHHPVRLFVGSGMPRGLWRRVTRRFAPAGVLEFYAPTEGDAVLVNLSGAKPGSLGRPLPGSANVAIAAYDTQSGRLGVGPRGFTARCEDGETGMLLAQVDPDETSLTTTPLRGVFARDDAWLATGDLFRRDEDGDHWLVGSVASLIDTAAGHVAPYPIQDALADVEAIDLAVAYGVPARDGEVAVAAVTVRDGHELSAADVTAGPGRPGAGAAAGGRARG